MRLSRGSPRRGHDETEEEGSNPQDRCSADAEERFQSHYDSKCDTARRGRICENLVEKEREGPCSWIGRMEEQCQAQKSNPIETKMLASSSRSPRFLSRQF